MYFHGKIMCGEGLMITSNQNQQFKYLMKLKNGKYRNIYQEAIIFGEDIILAAKKAKLIQTMIVTKEMDQAIVLSDALFDKLANYHMENKRGAVIKIKPLKQSSTHALLCENIQDPRNLGALFRSALAFNFKHIYLSTDTVDPYHELALRAAKGATFELSIYKGHINEHINTLKQKGYKLIATSPRPVEKVSEVVGFVALVLGNEGQGLTKSTMQSCDGALHITTNNVESLNVSVAGAISMYDIRRRS